jgi:hypothetical protein
LEIGRSKFKPRFLKNLCAGKEFIWHSKAPKGRSGDILLGIDMEYFDIWAIDEGEFYVNSICGTRKTISNGL